MRNPSFFLLFLALALALVTAFPVYSITVSDPNNNIIAYFNNDTSKTTLLTYVGHEIQVYGRITESGSSTQFNRQVILYTSDGGNDVEIASKNATNGLVIFNLTITPEDEKEGKLFLKMKAILDTDGNLSTTDDRIQKESNLVKLIISKPAIETFREFIPLITVIAVLALVIQFIRKGFRL